MVLAIVNCFGIFTEKEESGIAPHFTKPLKPQIVEETAVLECVVVGKPTPNVKWYKKDKEITETTKQKITFNPETGVAKLELLEVTPEDETIYKVKADNKFGKAECRANLVISKSVEVTQPVVMHAPKITKPVQAIISKPDKDIVLEAEFEGTPTPEIKWLRNGKEIKPSESYEITTETNTTKLKISKKAPQKAGKYEVKATNPKGQASSAGSVTVTEDKEMEKVIAPRFIKAIQPQTVAPGEVVIMEAVVEAYPTASFQWYIGSLPLKSSPEMRITTTENKSVLYINEVTTEMAGPVTCRAQNVVGSVTCTATVNIVEETDWEETTELEYPRFIEQLTPIRVMDGEKVLFTCKVTGKPVPKVEWFHDNQPVHEAKDVVISQDTEGICTLAISEVFPENAGEYVCHAINKVGEAICKTSLIVEGRSQLKFFLIHALMLFIV